MSEFEMKPAITPPEAAVRGILEQAGLGGDYQIAQLTGGANNRVYRLTTEAGPVLLKWYFGHPDDPRDRLQAEFGFANLAWYLGLEHGPRPLASDPTNRLGLFEFIEGRRPAPADLNERAIAAAFEFVVEINEFRHLAQADALPPAAEACFSLAEHAACVQGRVDRLKTISISDDIDREAAQFVKDELEPLHRAIAEATMQTAVRAKLPWDKLLAKFDRCLSPSDFGYHNAILTNDGRVRFFDFEYAGWDDPAKLLCDFFHQVQVPVPPEHFNTVVAAMAPMFQSPDSVRLRTECLMDLYGIKWCCIVLNEFLPTSAARRVFSRSDAGAGERKSQQLLKAREILDQLQKSQTS